MRRLLAVLTFVVPGLASAQVNLLPSTAWGFAPNVSAWHFTTPLTTSGGLVQDVAQAAVPFQVRIGAGAWTFDVTGAYAAGAVHMTSPKSSSSGDDNGDNVLLLAGPTDVKVRMSGPLAGDRLLLIAGVNLPTGTTRLDADQLNVLQAVSAPGLAMPAPTYGTGTGATLGLIDVLETAGWTLALGGSVEKRTEYTPIALAVSGASGSDTHLTPGIATHLTIGADRLLGSSRLNVLLLTDTYSTDKISFGGDAGSGAGATQYRLGPQMAGLARLDFSGDKWSEGALTIAVRHRSAFSDAGGLTVAGSDGNYVDGSLGGVLGGADRTGLVIGVDGRWQSGLPFTTALVGAAATAGGATLGVETRHFRFALHGQYGTFDTGLSHTTGYGGSLSLSFFAGRGPQ